MRGYDAIGKGTPGRNREKTNQNSNRTGVKRTPGSPLKSTGKNLERGGIRIRTSGGRREDEYGVEGVKEKRRKTGMKELRRIGRTD
jgi:hypothetical protein